MRRTVMIAVLCAILGAIVGSGVSRAIDRRHQHTRAVMWLAQIHLQRLDQAAQARACQSLEAEVDSLNHLQTELVQAFAPAYRQDGEFRARAEALAGALRNAAARADCAASVRRVPQIREACDACHREYR
jgi:cytochrome c556